MAPLSGRNQDRSAGKQPLVGKRERDSPPPSYAEAMRMPVPSGVPPAPPKRAESGITDLLEAMAAAEGVSSPLEGARGVEGGINGSRCLSHPTPPSNAPAAEMAILGSVQANEANNPQMAIDGDSPPPPSYAEATSLHTTGGLPHPPQTTVAPEHSEEAGLLLLNAKTPEHEPVTGQAGVSFPASAALSPPPPPNSSSPHLAPSIAVLTPPGTVANRHGGDVHGG